MTATILELYPYLLKAWEHICSPADDDSEIFPNGNSWNWDSESWSTVKLIFTSFEHVVACLPSKELLELIKPIAECLQGQLQEVYFGYQKIDYVKEH